MASQGGEGGAPQGDPSGGLVDSGPLSFDTKWYDWGAYAAEMIRRIKLHWDVPELGRLGWKGSLTVRFYILANGRVADAKIIRYSGIPPFDNAALQAILKSSPFGPLPDELHEEREGVTVTFLYNMRVDERFSPRPATSPARLENLRMDPPTFAYPRYVERVGQLISSNWFKPAQTVQKSPEVHFQIERDGTITNIRIVVSSGLPFVDRAALRAVMSSSPLPPLPAQFNGPHLGIQVVFE